jgi:PAS domain S-box-containing protein
VKAAIKKKERYRQLAEMTSDWLWEIDRDGFYTYASPVVYDLLGYRPEEVIGKKPFDFMPSEEAARIERIFQKAVERGSPLKSIENVNLHKNGEHITLETSGVAIRDVEGNVVGYRGIDRNISARKLAEKKLAKETVKLKQALREVKRLSGMLPICSSCKRIRDDKGYWNQIEAYISEHSDAQFSHGLCPNCFNRLYPDLKYPVRGM